MPTRRKFVTSTLGAGALLATQAPRKAAAQADRRLIVDAQVHLWKAESEDWKWVPGIVPQLPEPFTIERLVPMMDEAGVDRVVIVPPSWPGDRNDYALEAARRYPTRFRVMGKIPLQDPKSAALLPRWREQPGMAGLRVIFNTAQTLPWLTDGTVDWLWAAAEKAELPIMCFAPCFAALSATELPPGTLLVFCQSVPKKMHAVIQIHTRMSTPINPTAAFIGGDARVPFSVLIQTRTNIIRLQTPTRIASAFGPRRRTGAARWGMWDRSLFS